MVAYMYMLYLQQGREMGGLGMGMKPWFAQYECVQSWDCVPEWVLCLPFSVLDERQHSLCRAECDSADVANTYV